MTDQVQAAETHENTKAPTDQAKITIVTEIIGMSLRIGDRVKKILLSKRNEIVDRQDVEGMNLTDIVEATAQKTERIAHEEVVVEVTQNEIRDPVE